MSKSSFKIDKTIVLTPQATLPSDPQAGEIVFDSSVNKFKQYDGSSWSVINSGTVIDNTHTITVKDTLFTVQDNADVTKQMQFELSGITTGQTRTITVPDASTTLMGTDVTQTVSNKSLINASNKFVDATDPTKKIGFDSSSATTGTTLTLSDNQTTSATLFIPNVGSGDFVVTNNTQATLINKKLGWVETTVVTNSTTTGASATLTPLSAGVIIVTNAGLTGLSGINSGNSGQQVTIENQTGVTISIKDEDAGASAGNRIRTGTGAAVNMAPNSTYTFLYDSTAQRWMLLGGSGSGGLSAWSASTIYKVGDVVTYEKQAYIALAAHTSSSTFEPDIISAKWTLLNKPQINDNIMSIGNSFEDGDVSGWTGTGVATVTNGLPVSVGSGGAAFSSANGGRALGANTSAPSVVSSGQLSGAYSLNLATTGAGTIGDGYISSAYPIDIKYQSKVLSFRFDYKVVSGSPNMSGTSSNTYAVAIYDVANNNWIIPSGVFNFVQSTGVGTCSGSFQTSSNSTSLQIFVYSPVAPTGASSLYLDDFYIGPQATTNGAAINDWASYTPTLVNFGNGTAAGKWRRVGDSMEIQAHLIVGSSLPTGIFTFSLPSGYAIDTNKITTTNFSGAVGFGQAVVSGAGYALSTLYNSSTTFFFGALSSASGSQIAADATHPVTWANGNEITSIISVPISGWSSNSEMSNDTDTRVVAARYTNTAGTSVGLSIGNLPYPTLVFDTHSAYNTSTGIYTVPVTGKYQIQAKYLTAAVTLSTSQTINLFIYKNGSIVDRFVTIGNGASNAYPVMNATTVDCNAGDTLEIRSSSSVATTVLTGVPELNSLSIERISGPSVIAASETLAVRANTSTTSIAYNTLTQVIYSAKTYDTHGSNYNSSTGVFTANSPGFYSVKAAIHWNNLTTTTTAFFFVAIYKNGAIYSSGTFMPRISNEALSTVSDTVQMIPGDTITIYAYQADSSPNARALSGIADRNYLAIEKIK